MPFYPSVYLSFFFDYIIKPRSQILTMIYIESTLKKCVYSAHLQMIKNIRYFYHMLRNYTFRNYFLRDLKGFNIKFLFIFTCVSKIYFPKLVLLTCSPLFLKCVHQESDFLKLESLYELGFWRVILTAGFVRASAHDCLYAHEAKFLRVVLVLQKKKELFIRKSF